MVSLFVAITDDDWFSYLAVQPQLDEVNFWQPRGKVGFQAIKRGELFLFKLHSPRNFIVDGGIFERSSTNVPLWLAWDSFGTRNGAATFEEMQERISRYTHARADARSEIGCRLLEASFFLPEEAWIPVPPSWSPHIQVGKTFTTEQADGRYLWALCVVPILKTAPALECDEDKERFEEKLKRIKTAKPKPKPAGPTPSFLMRSAIAAEANCIEPESLRKRHRRIIPGDGDNASPSDHLGLGGTDQWLGHTFLGELAGASHYWCPCILRFHAEAIILKSG